MKRMVILHGGVWLAGYVAGVVTLYLAGPAIGARLSATGARLTAMARPGEAVVLDGTVAADLHRLATTPTTVYQPTAPKRELGPMAKEWGR